MGRTNWSKVKSTRSRVNSRSLEAPLLTMRLTLRLSERNGKKCRTLPWRHSVKRTRRTRRLTLMEARNKHNLKRKRKTKRINLIEVDLFCCEFFFFKLFCNLLIYDE